ncbi:MAG TPA: ABC transporter permease, partial [Cyclobacteriaceae bacterium]|nr:ABC transporter permease [Cyclobacteriaceae bacterium]
MNAAKLVLRYLLDKKLSTVLNIFLLSLGTAVIVILILFNRQLEERISANAKGIDLVVGAKGSPLQLILCSVFHVDFPTGNIKLRDTEAIVKNPLIKEVIPLSLGDNFNGYRLVGTTKKYADLYGGTLSTGAWFEKEMEVVAGSTAARLGQLKVGDKFASSHGLTTDGDHHDTNFIVTGILAPTNSVLDNLILTSVESVWHVHEHGDEADDESKPVTNPYTLVPSVDRSDTIKEVTSLLIQFRNPMAAIQLPRFINSQTKMQAASPAFETAR